MAIKTQAELVAKERVVAAGPGLADILDIQQAIMKFTTEILQASKKNKTQTTTKEQRPSRDQGPWRDVPGWLIL